MATKKSKETLVEELERPEALDDLDAVEVPEELNEADLEEVELEEVDAVEVVEEPIAEDEFEDDEDDAEFDEDDDEEHDEETADALEELENQELQLLDDEANEAMLVDEVEELRAMRRAELTMNVDAQVQKSDEFVCQSCFMVKRTSQLANKRKMICQDCVA
jgi:hypothetical protein